MTTCSRRSFLSPPVIRHFEFTRLQNQSIALAYQALIPVVSRRSGTAAIAITMTTSRPPRRTQGLRSKARGA